MLGCSKFVRLFQLFFGAALKPQNPCTAALRTADLRRWRGFGISLLDCEFMGAWLIRGFGVIIVILSETWRFFFADHFLIAKS